MKKTSCKDISKAFYDYFELNKIGVVEQVMLYYLLADELTAELKYGMIELENKDRHDIDVFEDIYAEVLYWNTNKPLAKIVKIGFRGVENIMVKHIKENEGLLPRIEDMWKNNEAQEDNIIGCIAVWLNKSYTQKDKE